MIHYIYTPQGTSDVRAPHLALRRQEGAAVTAEEPPQRTGVSRMQDRWPCSVVQEAAVGDGGAERWRCTSTLRTTPRRRSTADRGEASPALVYAGMPRSVARRDAPNKAAGTTEGVGYFEDSREEHTERLGIAYTALGHVLFDAQVDPLAVSSQGDFSKAIKNYGQRLAIAKEVGDRAGEGRAYRNLGWT